MIISHPNAHADLIGIRGIIALTDSIVQQGGTLHPDFTFEVHADTWARYQAARAGTVFDPSTLKAMRDDQERFPMVHRPIAEAKDVERVISRLQETGDLSGKAQLPGEPLKQIIPLAVVSSIAAEWLKDLDSVRKTPNGSAQKAKLEDLAHIVLDETNPNRPEPPAPEEDESDIVPLFIAPFTPLRFNPDQQEYIEMEGVSAQDFAITKSAVGAFITLVGQHKLSPEVTGLSEMYRRGLFPLALLTNKQVVVDRICILTGRTEDELRDAIASVEKTHAIQRSDFVHALVEEYDARFAPVEEELAPDGNDGLTPDGTDDKQTLGKDGVTPNVPDGVPTPTGKKQKGKDYGDIEGRLNNLSIIFGYLIYGICEMSDAIDDHVLHPSSDLMRLGDSFTRDDKTFTLGFSPLNHWFDAVALSHTRTLARVTTLPQSDPDVLDRALGIYNARDRQRNAFCYITKARASDIFVEAAFGYSTAKELQTCDVNQDVSDAVYCLEKITGALVDLRLNMIYSLRDPARYKDSIPKTDKWWSKLAHNPELIIETPKSLTCVDLDDTETYGTEAAVYISMLYGIPLSLTRAYCTNTYRALHMELNAESLPQRIGAVRSMDPMGTLMSMARSWRNQLSTSDRKLVNSDLDEEPVRFVDKDALAKELRPVAQRYDPLFDIVPVIEPPVMGRY